MRKKCIWIMLFIFIIALLLRIQYVLTVSTVMAGKYEDNYKNVAANLIDGKGYAMFWKGKVYHAYYPPAYPLFLAGIFAITGADSYRGVRIIQSFIGAISCILIYIIALKLYGEYVAIISGIISSLYNGLIFFNGILMPATLYIFLSLLMILVFLRIKDNPNMRALIILGILIGTAMLTRTQVVFFIPFIPGCLMLAYPNIYSRKMLLIRDFSIILIFVVLTICPWIFRNFIIYEKFVFDSRGGAAFYCHFYDYRHKNNHKDNIRATVARNLSELEEESYFYNRLFSLMKNEPRWFFLNRLPRNISRNVYDFIFKKQRTKFGNPVIPLFSWLPFIMPLGLVGFVLSLYKYHYQWRKTITLYLYIFSQIFFVVFLLKGYPRFRLLVEPFFIIFAALSIQWIFKLIKDRLKAWSYNKKA